MELVGKPDEEFTSKIRSDSVSTADLILNVLFFFLLNLSRSFTLKVRKSLTNWIINNWIMANRNK